MQPPEAAPLRPDITQALLDVGAGDAQALHRLFPAVYAGLRQLARARLGADDTDPAQGASALVHEAWQTLVDQSRVQRRSRSHFFATASIAMRRILVEYARASAGTSPGVAIVHIRVEEARDVVSAEDAGRILALDEALDRLRAFNPRGADIVVCRYFGGLDLGETAEALGVTPAAVRRGWDSARAWLHRQLDDGEPG